MVNTLRAISQIEEKIAQLECLCEQELEQLTKANDKTIRDEQMASRKRIQQTKIDAEKNCHEAIAIYQLNVENEEAVQLAQIDTQIEDKKVELVKMILQEVRQRYGGF